LHADADLTRSLGLLSVGLNPAKFTCPCRERARLEESAAQSHLSILTRRHNLILVPERDLQWTNSAAAFAELQQAGEAKPANSIRGSRKLCRTLADFSGRIRSFLRVADDSDATP